MIKNETFKKVLIVSFILFVFTITYGFVLWNYDLTLINTYDYNYNLNPCTSENDYNFSSRIFVCMIYHEEAIINKTIGLWKGPDFEVLKYPLLESIKAEAVNYTINRDQVVLCFAGASVARCNESFDKLLIFDQIFAGGALGIMSSRLFELRERTGLFYSIGGSLLAYSAQQQGMVFIKTIVSCDTVNEAERIISESIDHAADTITDEEFTQARNAIISSLIDNFESNRQTASSFLFLERYNFPQDFFDKRAHQLSLISKEDVFVAAKAILDSKKMITVKIGRIEQCKEK